MRRATGNEKLPYPIWYAERVPLELLTLDSLLAGANSRQPWLDKLANNIAEQGLVNPLIVHNTAKAREEHGPMWIAVGNSRYMAVKRLGWTHVPCLILGECPVDGILLKTQGEVQSYIHDGRVRFRTHDIIMGGVTLPETEKYPRRQR